MKNNVLIFKKEMNEFYIAMLRGGIYNENGFWLYGTGIGRNKFSSFFSLCKELLFFNHLREIFFVKKVIVYGE